MRYWVYLNDKVMEKPFEEGELSSVPGFNADTLVCKETPAPGETQEWLPAKMVIEAYKRPVPPPPPPPQILSKFAPQQNTEAEPKVTVFSGNIFGSSSDNNEISIGGQTPYKMSDITATNLAKQDQINETQNENSDKAAEKFYTEPATEILSLEEVEELNDDNQYTSTSTSEEEVLKTAIKTLISHKPKEKEEPTTLQAIDLTNNKNIDLSNDDGEGEYFTAGTKSIPPRQEKQNVPAQDTKPTPAPAAQAQVQQPAVTQQQEAKEEAPSPIQETPAQQPVEHQLPVMDIQQPAQQPQQEQPLEGKEPSQPVVENVIEEEYKPKEEISSKNNDSAVNPEEMQIPSLNSVPPKEVDDVLKEFAQEKEDERREEFLEEKELEEAFSTSPSEISDLPIEKEQEIGPNLSTGEENILDVSQPNSKEQTPTTLEDLTGKFPPPEQNIQPDPVQTPQEQQPEGNPQENISSEKDNFLTTFSSDIETVFLDQPTAFISDYIPPAETGRAKLIQEQVAQQPEELTITKKTEILDIRSDKGQHQVSLQNVRRVKPAAIKTIPMVEGEHASAFSNTQIRELYVAEEAMAKIEKKNNLIGFFKIFGLFTVLLIMLIGLLAVIAEIGIMPKVFSPFHAMLNKKDAKVETETQTGPVSLEEIALKDLRDAETLRINKVISEVKQFKLNEGLTLEEKIKLLHPDIYEDIKWEASQLPNDLTYYTISVSLPPNPEGYSPVNYRFNYNTVTYNVEATNSEANNVMIKPLKREELPAEQDIELEP